MTIQTRIKRLEKTIKAKTSKGFLCFKEYQKEIYYYNDKTYTSQEEMIKDNGLEKKDLIVILPCREGMEAH